MIETSEDEELMLQLIFTRAYEQDQNIRRQTPYTIGPTGFNDPMSDRYCKDGKVFIGRQNLKQETKTDIPVNQRVQKCSRRQVCIDHRDGAYWVTDVSHAGFPTYMQIRHDYGIQL